MKAVTPVRPQKDSSYGGSNDRPLHYLSEHSLNISRCKMEEEDLFCLQYDMNDCYSRLKRLVPTIPQDKKVSKVEILQHVIDYILDLQLALETHPSLNKPQQRTGTCPPASNPSRTPLTVLNIDHQRTSIVKKPEDSILCRWNKKTTQWCAARTEPVQSQQIFARDSHPLEAQSQGDFKNRWEELNRNNNAIYITFFFCSNEGPRYPSILFVLAIITLFLVIWILYGWKMWNPLLRSFVGNLVKSILKTVCEVCIK